MRSNFCISYRMAIHSTIGRQEMTKLIKSRRNYTCHECKTPINKGDKYRKSTKSIGSPQKWTVENGGFVQHGFRYTVKLCEDCA